LENEDKLKRVVGDDEIEDEMSVNENETPKRTALSSTAKGSCKYLKKKLKS
jgi:hypothetical protein